MTNWVIVIRNIDCTETEILDLRHQVQDHIATATGQHVPTYTLAQDTFDHVVAPIPADLIPRQTRPTRPTAERNTTIPA